MQFRTQEQLDQARWAERYLNVGSGKQYSQDNSPFPLQAYFNNPLLGKTIKMLQVNAGSTLVDSFVADTMTDMSVVVNEGDKAVEQEIWEWWNANDYPILLEGAMRNYYASGFGLQQPVFQEGKVYVSNVDPSRWYPDMPVFDWQSVTSGKVITPLYEMSGTEKQWYAFVEEHEIGKINYRLFKLRDRDALEGKDVGLGAIPRLSGLKQTAQTQLETFDIIQVDRSKSSESLLGQSILLNVWDQLQEVTEIQTQIRQERIKHLKAKMYGARKSFMKAESVVDLKTTTRKFTEMPESTNGGAYYDMNQEIMFVEDGGTIPGYVQRDLESITKGMELIDKLLSQIAFTVGAPRSIFNLDEKGDIKVDTEKRKDKKYVRQVLQAQKRASSLAVQITGIWWQWTHAGQPPPTIDVKFANPFGMSQEETVSLMREMNPDAKFVSQQEAVKNIWANKTPEEIDGMLKEITDEEPEPVTNQRLNSPIPVKL